MTTQIDTSQQRLGQATDNDCLGGPCKGRRVETITQTVYTGDEKAVANEAARKKPDNPKEVIAKNTKEIVRSNDDEE